MRDQHTELRFLRTARFQFVATHLCEISPDKDLAMAEEIVVQHQRGRRKDERFFRWLRAWFSRYAFHQELIHWLDDHLSLARSHLMPLIASQVSGRCQLQFAALCA